MNVSEVVVIILSMLLGYIASVIVNLLKRSKDAYGIFRIKPVTDEDGDTGLYSVNVAIVPNQNLINKKRIILVRDSQD